ncbi:NADH:flavin oxidoreductase [Pusillimonas sp. SM2304]|uniref:NADH:flavin oxidoreductase n=1 Tax=Pusillimonas sp. SM2304 TaxID=3073241 RepID=UPI002876FD2D|nr:NADH:flavin oxidoreductase [Pusillimonas sp. SM2304]MDS1139017.1 NADH:flavin oxidoreductase [Pusillimonas sp. SM2304]
MDTNHIQNSPSPLRPDIEPLFTPLRLGALTLPNRLAVAPMTRVSATAQGIPTPRMGDYYSGFAEGGFGLVITEGIYTDEAFSQGYLFQPGLANDPQRDAWKTIVAGVQAQGGRVIAQLMHAGALSQGKPWRAGTIGPSALRPKGQQMRFYRGSGDYAVPQAMTQQDITHAVSGFANAARRAREAGFDGVEIHGANGYLLDQFLSKGINLREDGYGGDVQGRLRLIAEVVHAVRAAVGADFVLGLRVSQSKVNDFQHKWLAKEAPEIFQRLAVLPLDYLHTTEFQAWMPAFGQGASLAALAKQHVAMPVLANGSLHDPGQARLLLERGEADFVSLGRGALTHADWPRRARAGAMMQEFDPAILSPIADLANADSLRGEPATPL